MLEIVEFLVFGAFLGIASGIFPGPLLTITISETLQYGKWEGIKVVISSLITDLPIVLSILFILSHLTSYNFIIGIISFFGASYLTYSGMELLKIKQKSAEFKLNKKASLKRGILVNFGNPHPYLFWLSRGGPIIFKSFSIHFLATILFIICFYNFLVGSKAIIALIVEKSKYFIKSKYYFFIICILGIAQIIFGLTFIKVGLNSLDII